MCLNFFSKQDLLMLLKSQMVVAAVSRRLMKWKLFMNIMRMTYRQYVTSPYWTGNHTFYIIKIMKERTCHRYASSRLPGSFLLCMAVASLIFALCLWTKTPFLNPKAQRDFRLCFILEIEMDMPCNLPNIPINFQQYSKWVVDWWSEILRKFLSSNSTNIWLFRTDTNWTPIGHIFVLQAKKASLFYLCPPH